MARKKVKMAFIENDSSRKATYKKRKRGLLKKANELATLCDAPICVVINSAYESSPEFWPSREEADKVVSQWMRLPLMDKTKNMVNQQTFLEGRIAKATDSCNKQVKENKELEMKHLMFDCLSGKTSVPCIDKNDLPHFGYFLDKYLKDVNRMIAKRSDESSDAMALVSDAAAAATTSHAMAMVSDADVATTSHAMAMVDMGSSSSVGFPDNIQNRLTLEQTSENLDLNKKQK